jgi:hypothetical protein
MQKIFSFKSFIFDPKMQTQRAPMIHKRYICCLSLVLLTGLYTVTAFGQSFTDQKRDAATPLIQQLTLQENLMAPQTEIQQLLKRNFFSLPEQQSQQLEQSFVKGYDGKYLLNVFRDSLQNRMTPELKEKVSAWLSRSSTQAVSRVLQQDSTLPGKRKRVIAMYKTEQHPPKTARKRTLSTFWDTTSSLHQPIASSLIAFRSIIKAFGMLSGKQHLSKDRIDMIVRNYKNKVLLPSIQAGKKPGIRSMAVKYYGVDTDDLQKFTSFFESDAGQKLLKVIDKSMQAAYQAGSKQFLNQIKKQTENN